MISINDLIIIILIIIILFLFYKLIEFENFVDLHDMKPNLDNKSLKENDKINELVINNKNDNLKTELKQNNNLKSELNQEIDISLPPENISLSPENNNIDILNDNNNISTLKNDKKSENNILNEPGGETSCLKGEVSLPLEQNNNIKYSTKEIDNEMNKRFEKQPEEYAQAFKDNSFTGFIYKDNVITDENIYTFDGFNYITAHQLFIPSNYKTKPEDYGRNYIPPELWYKNNRRLNLPLCFPVNGRCLVKDVPTIGFPVNAIEWHSSK